MVTVLLEHLGNPKVYFLALLVFGLLPGMVTRLLAHLYPEGDPRRAEMIGELYAVPRWNRPMWVCEQIETAAFEGFGARRARRRRLRLRRNYQRWSADAHNPWSYTNSQRFHERQRRLMAAVGEFEEWQDAG